MKLDELCLGYLPLGQLCLYREGDGETISMNDLWFASKQDKIDWNKNVWNKFNYEQFRSSLQFIQENYSIEPLFLKEL